MAGMLTTHEMHAGAASPQLVGERQTAEQLAAADVRAAVDANGYGSGGTALLATRSMRLSFEVS
jgi:hypothetical protein